MRYLSLFTGIGGFEKGIEQAFQESGLPPPECVGYSEILRSAIQMISAPADGEYQMVDSSRYHALGNAVSIPVIKEITKRIYETKTEKI